MRKLHLCHDIRFVVTSLKDGSAERMYDTLYCARGQAENLIKLHKAQLKSDRTSCRSANANQMRLILHTAAYWLMWKLRQAIPVTSALRAAEFTTLRTRLIKVAARVVNQTPKPQPASPNKSAATAPPTPASKPQSQRTRPRSWPYPPSLTNKTG